MAGLDRRHPTDGGKDADAVQKLGTFEEKPLELVAAGKVTQEDAADLLVTVDAIADAINNCMLSGTVSGV